LPTTRYHLFRRVRVFSNELRKFVALVLSPHVTFPSYVKDLCIVAERSHGLKARVGEALSIVRSRKLGTMVGRTSLEHKMWVAILPGFVNMKSLGVVGFCGSELKEASLLMLPSLTGLRFIHCRFDNLDQMVDIICSGSRTLDTLSICNCRWGPSTTPTIDLPSPPSLKDLFYMPTKQSHDVINWLLLHEHAYKNMKKLFVDEINVSPFLQAIGSSLHDFSFWVNENKSKSVVQMSFSSVLNS
jgi:hypothetical protein